MNVFIVGLGLMGASYAEGLKAKGYRVNGFDQDDKTMAAARQSGLINNQTLDDISEADVVILALYPKDNIRFMQDHACLLKPGQILTDLSGVKQHMMNAIEALLPDGVSYTSHHPMAGREKKGFSARDATMFHHANALIITGAHTGPQDETVILNMLKDLKFGKITVVDAHVHDQLIAFTSQLTHVMAVALIQADHHELTRQATGDSFRDLTRIAKINETMWSELFLENKDALLEAIDMFRHEIDQVRQWIRQEDKASLMRYLREAREKRQTFDQD